MRNTARAMVAVILLLKLPVGIAWPETQLASAIPVLISLTDGSELRANLTLQSVTIESESAGTVHVPISDVDRVTLGSPGRPNTIHLRNGDRLQCRLPLDLWPAEAVFGSIAIPREAIREIHALPQAGNIFGPLQGLALYFNFDRNDGDTVPDMSGHGHDGEVVGATFVARPTGGGHLQFSGTGDHVVVRRGEKLNPTQFTISAWVLTRERISQGARGIVGKHRVVHNTHFLVLRQDEKRIGLCMSISANMFGCMNVDAQPMLDTWGMVTATYDSRAIRLFLNGKFSSQGVNASYLGNKEDWLIGAMEWDAAGKHPQRFWKGAIDEVRIYNRALTDAEVLDLYESSKAALGEVLP